MARYAGRSAASGPFPSPRRKRVAGLTYPTGHMLPDVGPSAGLLTRNACLACQAHAHGELLGLPAGPCATAVLFDWPSHLVRRFRFPPSLPSPPSFSPTSPHRPTTAMKRVSALPTVRPHVMSLSMTRRIGRAPSSLVTRRTCVPSSVAWHPPALSSATECPRTSSLMPHTRCFLPLFCSNALPLLSRRRRGGEEGKGRGRRASKMNCKNVIGDTVHAALPHSRSAVAERGSFCNPHRREEGPS